MHGPASALSVLPIIFTSPFYEILIYQNISFFVRRTSPVPIKRCLAILLLARSSSRPDGLDTSHKSHTPRQYILDGEILLFGAYLWKPEIIFEWLVRSEHSKYKYIYVRITSNRIWQPICRSVVIIAIIIIIIADGIIISARLFDCGRWTYMRRGQKYVLEPRSFTFKQIHLQHFVCMYDFAQV